MNISEKVQQLKSSFTVEGTPLFKSDRFTDEQIEKMRKESSCHISHWYGLTKGSKVWSDEEIATQIEVFFNTPLVDEVKFKNIVENIYKALPLKDKDAERKAVRELIFGILNWTEEKNGLSKLWVKFGSAPSALDGKFHGNKLLEKYSKLYGAESMETIFEGQFSAKFHLFWYSVNNALLNFETVWDEMKKRKDLQEKVHTSPYNSLDEIEESVVVKKISVAAKDFYLDRSKPFSERIKVFAKYGKFEDFIFEPTDSNLKKIFQIYQEGGWLERHQNVETPEIVDFWIGTLKSNRTHLNWSNPYHPKKEKRSRNYKPRKEAIERLRKYYMEKLFLEGVGSFEFDW